MQSTLHALRGNATWVARLVATVLLVAGCTRSSTKQAAPAPRPPRLTVPQFTDAAERLGIRFSYDHGGSGRYYYTEIAGGGGALFDYDGDGWLDVYLVQGAPLPGYAAKGALRNRLYRNREGRGFEDVTARAGVDGVRDGKKVYGIGCAAGDYDNDGAVDLFVTGFGDCILYRNTGRGAFRDVTREAGIRPTLFGSSAALFDYDRDGHLDLLVCEYVRYSLGDDIRCANPKKKRDYCQPGFFPPTPSRLYRNLGNGRFADVTAAAGITRDYNKALGVVAGDFDDDGDADLYLTCDLTPNLLYVNQGNGKFKEDAVSLGCALNDNGQAQAGMGVDMRDVDGDLRPDIVVTNYWAENNNLYQNLAGGVFADASSAMGLAEPSLDRVGFGTGLSDLDNDGWPDVFVTNGHVLAHPEDVTPGTSQAQKDQLFLNTGRGGFRDVSGEAGPWFSHPHVGRGAAFGDIDNDGDLDILVTSNVGPAALLLNDGGNRGHWLQFRLRGRQSNRDGIGARIDVTAGGRTQRDEVRSAYSYLCANDLRAHFGLGTATKAEKVEIRWPSGKVDALSDLAADRLYEVAEGEGVRR